MIREQIADLLWEDRSILVNPTCRQQAERILALPSGLEAVSRCPDKLTRECTYECRDANCHSTGEIARDLTWGEVAEIPAMLLDGRAKFEDKLHCDNAIVTNQRCIILPSGERVRVKEEET